MTKPQRPPVSSGVRTTGIPIGVPHAARELVRLAFAITRALLLSPAAAWLQTMRWNGPWQSRWSL